MFLEKAETMYKLDPAGEQIEDPLGGRAASTNQAQSVESKAFQNKNVGGLRPLKQRGGDPLFIYILLWNAFASTDWA